MGMTHRRLCGDVSLDDMLICSCRLDKELVRLAERNAQERQTREQAARESKLNNTSESAANQIRVKPLIESTASPQQEATTTHHAAAKIDDLLR